MALTVPLFDDPTEIMKMRVARFEELEVQSGGVCAAATSGEESFDELKAARDEIGRKLGRSSMHTFLGSARQTVVPSARMTV